MLGLRSRFLVSLVLLTALAVLALAVAVRAGARARAAGRPVVPAAARAFVVPAVLAVLLATALPDSWPPPFTGGDLVLRPGEGGLDRLPQLWRAPGDLEAVLLVANVLLYVLLAAAISLGWGRPTRALACAAALTVLVESVQYAALERVAAVDDVLLNLTGAVLGVALVALPGRWVVPGQDSATCPTS